MTLEIRLLQSFPGFRLDVDLTLPGGVSCLFGRSGSGKTSIVNAVAGLLRPESARIVLDGTPLHDLPPHRREVGYVFQDARLFPHLTVAENLTYGPRVRRRKPEGMDRIVELWASARFWRGGPARCRGARSNASRSAGRFCRGPGFF